MTAEIIRAATSEQYALAADLFRAYARYLGVDLEFQGFSDELANIARMYGPPEGALLLARQEGRYVGVVGLRPLQAGIAEMKRLYVDEQAQGKGTGKLLMRAFLAEVSRLGYRKVRLDTIPELQAAYQLYEAFGFYAIEPYRFNPHPQAIFMELSLTG